MLQVANKNNANKIAPLDINKPQLPMSDDKAFEKRSILGNKPDSSDSISGDILQEQEKLQVGPTEEEEIAALEQPSTPRSLFCCHGNRKFNNGSLGSTLKYLVKAHNAFKVLTILVTIAVVLDLIALEVRWAHDNTPSPLTDVFKVFGSIATLISLYFLTEYYSFMNKYHLSKSGFEIKERNSFFSTELRTWFIMELLFLSIHSIPFLDGGVNIQEHTTRIRYHFSFDEFFGSFQVFRILFWIRGFHVWKGVATNMKNATFASIKKLEFNAWFSLRQQLYLKPLTTLLFILAAGSLLGGYVLMVCERPNSAEFAWFSNSLWVVLVTMTTVGYGDLYPSSTLGRMIAIAACLLGNFLFGLLVTSQASLIELSQPEKQATESLELLGHTKADSKDAAQVVVAALNYKYILKKFMLTTANEEARRKIPKVREAHDFLIHVLKQRRRRSQKFKRNAHKKDDSAQILQTLKLQSHLVMDLNRNVRDLGLVVAKLRQQVDQDRLNLRSQQGTQQMSPPMVAQRLSSADADVYNFQQPMKNSAQTNELRCELQSDDQSGALISQMSMTPNRDLEYLELDSG